MESSNIAVLTSITGSKDNLIENQCKGDAKFIAYLDKPWMSDTWEIRKAYDKFKDPRRNSRLPKLMPHLFVDTEYSIWIDGNMTLLKPPEEVVEKYLKDHDLAIFKHPSRDCIYDEALVCAKLNLDDPEIIIEQAKAYEESGYAKKKGLCECGMIIRRHTPEVQAFNEAWFAEYSRYSRRDQISFMYAVDKIGLRINAIKANFVEKDGELIRDDVASIVAHNHFEGNWNQNV